MADTSNVWNTPAMELEAVLSDMSMWPCMNPHCSNKVDPDHQQQFCSQRCINSVLSGRSSGVSQYKRIAHKMQLTAEWVSGAKKSGFIRDVGAAMGNPIPPRLLKFNAVRKTQIHPRR